MVDLNRNGYDLNSAPTAFDSDSNSDSAENSRDILMCSEGRWQLRFYLLLLSPDGIRSDLAASSVRVARPASAFSS
jgi:hypothetical protein